MANAKETVRVAAIGDLHCNRTSCELLPPLLTRASEEADVLLLCGDLADHGLPEQARLLAKALVTALKIPAVGVLGNHDFESGKQDEVARILSGAGVTMLDGDSCEIHGVGFVGVKGFGGGFGQHALEPWGEPAIKSFVREAIDETLKLEGGLSRLETPQRVVVLHYAPVQQTVEGEPPAIFPFLGSSRMEEPLNRYPVTAVVHGHAHHGRPEGHTSANVPVYNVAVPVLRQLYPEDIPLRILTIPVNPAAATAAAS